MEKVTNKKRIGSKFALAVLAAAMVMVGAAGNANAKVTPKCLKALNASAEAIAKETGITKTRIALIEVLKKINKDGKISDEEMGKRPCTGCLLDIWYGKSHIRDGQAYNVRVKFVLDECINNKLGHTHGSVWDQETRKALYDALYKAFSK